MYVGVDNPVEIVSGGHKTIDRQQVSASNATVTGENGYFLVRPIHEGEVQVTVKTGGKEAARKFIATPITPVPRLGAQFADGAILGNGAFKAQQGLAAVVECCGFDAKCDIVSYTVIRMNKAGELSRADNQGARYELAAMALVKEARPGDMYIFCRIMARCPGDKEPRRLETVGISIE